ncbi:phosphoribosylanthranilate isomerase [Croceibacterium aestuarii]|uniref:phosphoribosylanthranilate isomerase n=1 Tax=Croceibacterium aestuarii TaxID=3064139 RepID=UPI00272E7B94|nr:phosphoribosylanthranilate isomerase [Croceibacterium sp. D39]
MSEDTEIKICGLSTPETLDAAIAAGATHVGLVHYEPSPRHVSLEDAVKLRRRVPPSVKVVLLLVNMEAQPTALALEAVRPDVIQFHGSETPEWLALIKNNTSLEVWKAWGVRNAESLANALKYKDSVHKMLYDAPAQKLPGGTGTAIDWSIMEGFRHQIPWGLAGGLSPTNVAEAVARTGAPLVDASSGLESAPGVKDVDLIAEFCKAAREA